MITKKHNEQIQLMKKILLIAALVITGFSVNAQQGLKAVAGLSLSNVSYERNGIDISTSGFTGFHIGISNEFQVSDNLFIEPGILFSRKGTEINTTTSQLKLSISYLDFPVNLIYKHNLENDITLFAKGGPIISYGLSGTEDDGTDKDDIRFGNEEDEEIKRVDTGFAIGGGVEMKKIQVGASYTFGLRDLTNFNEASFKTGVFAISVGFFFLR